MLYILFSWLNNINQSALAEGAKLGPKFWISNPLNQTLSHLSETKIGYLKEYILVALQIKMGEKVGKSLSCPAAFLPTFLSFSFWSSVLSLHCPTPCGRSDSSEPPKWERQLKCHSHLPKQNFIPPNVLITCTLVYICSRLFGCLHACLFLEVVLWLRRGNEDRLNFLSSSHGMHFFSTVSITDIQTGDTNVRNRMRSRRGGFLTEARVLVSVTAGPVGNRFSFYLGRCPGDTQPLAYALCAHLYPTHLLPCLSLSAWFWPVPSLWQTLGVQLSIQSFLSVFKVIKVKAVLHRWRAITNAIAIKLSFFQWQKRRGL